VYHRSMRHSIFGVWGDGNFRRDWSCIILLYLELFKRKMSIDDELLTIKFIQSSHGRRSPLPRVSSTCKDVGQVPIMHERHHRNNVKSIE
jgi:hypothetical protein